MSAGAAARVVVLLLDADRTVVNHVGELHLVELESSFDRHRLEMDAIWAELDRFRLESELRIRSRELAADVRPRPAARHSPAPRTCLPVRGRARRTPRGRRPMRGRPGRPHEPAPR